MFRKFSKLFANIQKFKICIILFIDDSPFTRKDANSLLDKFEEMNSRQIEMKDRQIKIEREISDIRRLLASSGVESDYTTENGFITVSICI